MAGLLSPSLIQLDTFMWLVLTYGCEEKWLVSPPVIRFKVSHDSPQSFSPYDMGDFQHLRWYCSISLVSECPPCWQMRSRMCCYCTMTHPILIEGTVMREGRIIQVQREGVWSEKEPTKSRAETVLEWHSGPAIRAGHLRIITRTHTKTLFPQGLSDLESLVMWLVFGWDLGRAGRLSRSAAVECLNHVCLQSTGRLPFSWPCQAKDRQSWLVTSWCVKQRAGPSGLEVLVHFSNSGSSWIWESVVLEKYNATKAACPENPLNYCSPTVLASGISFMGDNSFMEPGGRVVVVLGWFEYITFMCISFLLSLHQLHLRSSGIRSWRLGTSALNNKQRQLERWLCNKVGRDWVSYSSFRE